MSESEVLNTRCTIYEHQYSASVPEELVRHRICNDNCTSHRPLFFMRLAVEAFSCRCGGPRILSWEPRTKAGQHHRHCWQAFISSFHSDCPDLYTFLISWNCLDGFTGFDHALCPCRHSSALGVRRTTSLPFVTSTLFPAPPMRLDVFRSKRVHSCLRSRLFHVWS